MTVLVTAATKNGSTGAIAQAIGTALTERGVPTVVMPPDEVRDIGEYDAVVLGSAVCSGHWLPAATALVERCSHAWAGRPVWLFSIGPIAKPGRSLTEKMGADPVDLTESARGPAPASTGRSPASSIKRTLLGTQGDLRD